MTTTEFRQYLRAAGEQLLLPVHPMELTERAARFIEDSRGDDAPGFTPEDLWIEPALGHPIPRYNVGDDGELLPWEGINPDLLWHPLLWLPKRVALPARFEFDDGSVEIETYTEWAIRVMLECMTVGLWDLERGWADVWSIAGVDTEADGFRDRVLAWQAGGMDAELDGVSLAAIFDDEVGGASAYRRARTLAEAVKPVAVGKHARTLAAEVADIDLDGDAETIHAAVIVLCGVGMVALEGDDDAFEQVADLYTRALSGEDDPADLVEALRELLTATADEYQDTVDAADEALAA